MPLVGTQRLFFVENKKIHPAKKNFIYIIEPSHIVTIPELRMVNMYRRGQKFPNPSQIRVTKISTEDVHNEGSKIKIGVFLSNGFLEFLDGVFKFQ